MMINDGRNPQVIYIPECGSTNALVKSISNSSDIASGTVFWADNQTEGRGMSGNSWESEKGKNLTFSVFFRPMNVSADMPFVILEMVSLCVKYTLDKYITGVAVKWPNDIYCGDKKIAGILIENAIVDGKITQSIIGIGININQVKFLSDAPNPVSLAQITGLSFDNNDILLEFREIFAEQSKRLNDNNFDDIHYDYLNTIYRKDGYHKYSDGGGIFDATIRDIEPDGYLVLERTDGSISRYAFKEVAFL